MLGLQQQQTTLSHAPAAGHAALLKRKCACGGSAGLTGQCAECDKERLTLQRKAANHPELSAASPIPPIVEEVLRSPGQSLDGDTRAFMEPRFGHNFGDVRVHNDAKAAKSARAVNALAYTVGQDVVFGANEYAPTTRHWRQLIAHELAHTVQQRSLAANPPSVHSDGIIESSANAAARAVGKGEAISSHLPASGIRLSRQPAGATEDAERARLEAEAEAAIARHEQLEKKWEKQKTEEGQKEAARQRKLFPPISSALQGMPLVADEEIYGEMKARHRKEKKEEEERRERELKEKQPEAGTTEREEQLWGELGIDLLLMDLEANLTANQFPHPDMIESGKGMKGQGTQLALGDTYDTYELEFKLHSRTWGWTHSSLRLQPPEQLTHKELVYLYYWYGDETRQLQRAYEKFAETIEDEQKRKELREVAAYFKATERFVIVTFGVSAAGGAALAAGGATALETGLRALGTGARAVGTGLRTAATGVGEATSSLAVRARLAQGAAATTVGGAAAKVGTEVLTNPAVQWAGQNPNVATAAVETAATSGPKILEGTYTLEDALFDILTLGQARGADISLRTSAPSISPDEPELPRSVRQPAISQSESLTPTPPKPQSEPTPKPIRTYFGGGGGEGGRKGMRTTPMAKVKKAPRVRTPAAKPSPGLSDTERALISSAERAVARLGKPLQVKTKSAAEVGDVGRSGFGPKGGGAERTRQVLDTGEEIGHDFAKNPSLDGGVPGQEKAGHAEKLAALANPGKALAVDQAMCLDCVAFFQKLAQARGTTLVVREPTTTWVFRPDGVRIGLPHSGGKVVLYPDGSASAEP